MSFLSCVFPFFSSSNSTKQIMWSFPCLFVRERKRNCVCLCLKSAWVRAHSRECVCACVFLSVYEVHVYMYSCVQAHTRPHTHIRILTCVCVIRWEWQSDSCVLPFVAVVTFPPNHTHMASLFISLTCFLWLCKAFLSLNRSLSCLLRCTLQPQCNTTL